VNLVLERLSFSLYLLSRSCFKGNGTRIAKVKSADFLKRGKNDEGFENYKKRGFVKSIESQVCGVVVYQNQHGL